MTTRSDDTIPDAPAIAEHEGALAAAVRRLPDVRTVAFTTRHVGAGYDRSEVDAFIAQIAEAVDDVRAASDSGRQELTNLRAENAKLRAAAGSDLEQEIAAGAVGLLSQAQLIADKAVADAEQYARDLVVTARNQYREILERAENSASQASATLASASAPPLGPAIPEIEYVRTYAQVAQIQLRSVLEALTEQVDRLGSVPQPALEPDGTVTPVSAPASVSAPTPASDSDEEREEPVWAPTLVDTSNPIEPQYFRSSRGR
ncbi:DivIVA domain-containing protein [Agromyces intestinalis]|uniref:Cell wall synthesis protein Wag31 n=1 Tax=Agromyces intestinalis TaxID=2592652 RepID=A0A5C1YFW5_9MICO|nr:DivIVA domain-containing protein [Agromyces intestinalis]QEO14425.1 DivIVA domain-containing protein [Agromyces intestinalis]